MIMHYIIVFSFLFLSTSMLSVFCCRVVRCVADYFEQAMYVLQVIFTFIGNYEYVT